MALRIVRKMDDLQREIGKIQTMTHDLTVFMNGLELLEKQEHDQAYSLIQEKIVNIEHLIYVLNELKDSLVVPPQPEPEQPIEQPTEQPEPEQPIEQPEPEQPIEQPIEAEIEIQKVIEEIKKPPQPIRVQSQRIYRTRR